MKSVKKVLCILMITALMLTSLPLCITANAADSVQADASLVLNRPQASVIVTEVTRVAYQSNSMKAPSGNNSVIVKSTPSGIPYLSSSRASNGYAGETPVATTIVFTPGVTLDETPTLSCTNSTVKWTGPVFSNGTYTWTVTGGTAMVGTSLVFEVRYVYSEVNAVTGRTYTNTYYTSGTSYVEPIATPAGLYSIKRSYNDFGVGTSTQNRSYVGTYILGKGTYGSIYNGGQPDGSIAFGTGSWINGGGWTGEYGMMQRIDGSDAQRNQNVAFKLDTNRPQSTVYFDKSINSTLSDINLRTVTTVVDHSDEADEIVDIYMINNYILNGFCQTASGATDDLSLTSDSVQAAQLNIVNPTTTLRAIGSKFISYFTGTGPVGDNTTSDYTLVFQYQTPAQWTKVYVSHSYNLRIVAYNKGALRTLVENIQSSDPTVMITTLPEGDYKGYNPQYWYYSSGWEAFSHALNAARTCLDKPDVSQADIDQAYTNLSTAYNGLVMNTADYTIAGAYYNQAISKNPNNYTLASWARLQTLLDKYRSDYSVLYQPAVDKMGEDIKNAINALEQREADYTNFNLLLETINNLKSRAETVYGKPAEQVYSGWSNLISVLTKSGCTYNELDGYTVENYLLISEQAKVDGYVILIERALNDVRLANADYTNATKAENAYKVIKTSYLVDDIRENLVAAYNALVALHGLDLTHQEEIDAATATLNYWLDLVEYKPADTTAALEVLAAARAIDRSLYSDLSAVDSAVASLESKLNLDIRYQSEINRAVSALQSAIDNLLANSADYSQVNAAIEAVSARERLIIETYEHNYGFTPETFYSNWSTVTTAVSNVIYGLDVTRQTQVNNYAASINSALELLRENTADYSEVTAIQNTAYQLCSTGGSLYTQASLNNLSSIYSNVETGLPISRQETVDGFVTTIQQAIDDLEYLPANYANVETQIGLANEKIAADNAYAQAHPGYTLYTSDSIAAVSVALAQVVDGLDIRYQNAVDGYASDIATAIGDLSYAPADYTAVNEALTRVPADTSIYTSLSLVTLNNVINGIKYDYTADKQANVDKYVTNINNALSKLKLKKADYSEVNAAIALVPSNSSIYTEDSWQALQDQIDAVVTGYDITRQSEVDKMAENINTALNLLAYKGADYTLVNEALALVPEDLTIYTQDTVDALNAAIDAVDYYCDITQQAKVNGYANAINAAINGLVELGASYASVDTAITNANAKINSGLYTDESVAAVQTKIDAVVRGYGISRQAEVEAMADAINTAAEQMQYKGADYGLVDTAIANANTKINSGLYTDESVAAVQAKINAVVRGYDVTKQSEVNAMAEAINTAAGKMQYKGADYSSVDTAITNANAKINSGLYTDSSIAAVQEKIDAVVRGYDVTKQNEVNAMAEAINTAATRMQYKGADYGSVDTAITNANAKINSGLYTDESVAAVQQKIDAVVRGYDVTKQNEVNAMAEAINTAVGKMQYKGADYSSVDTAITNANAKINSGLYTDESVAAVQAKIDAVVRGYNVTKQNEVDAMAEAVDTAVSQMQYKAADYSSVDTAITNANAKINSGLYTDSSVAAVQTKIDAVVRGYNITKQSEVNAMANAINTAAGQMQYKGANYSGVNTAIANANSKILTGYYTDESIAAVQAKIDAVVTGYDITRQAEVDKMAEDINTAVGQMQYKAADYGKVDTAITNANAKINSGLYTDESVAAVQAKIDAVVRGYNITRQAEVDEMAKAIDTAVSQLKYKGADYSAVETAIARANEKINSNLYTAATVMVVQSTIEAVEYGLGVDRQADVNQMAENINSAVSRLQYKAADYGSVDIAITNANAKINSGLYTDESVAAVQEKIDAVVRGYNISKQNEVNAMAEAINTAAGKMQYKGADYGSVDTAITNANAKINSGLYTDKSVAAVQEKIDAVVRGYNISKQNEVNAMAEAINTAAGKMNYKAADYDALNDAITKANAEIAKNCYTDESVAALNAEIAKVQPNLDITHQSEVDKWKNDIVKATKNLAPKLADYTELQKILNLLDNSASEIYTNTYMNFDEVMASISAYRENSVVLDLTCDRQSEVDEMVSVLQGYIDSLIPAADENFSFTEEVTVYTYKGVNYVYGFKASMTEKQFKNGGYYEAENVTVSVDRSSTRYVGTGSKITVTYSSGATEEYVVVIFGDLDGNGKADVGDVTLLSNYISGDADQLAYEQKLASNIVGSGSRLIINDQDLFSLKSVVSGDMTINQKTGKV